MSVNMSDYHRHRLELILLGMVLAKPGDSERLLKMIRPLDLRGETVVDCFSAIHEKDGRLLRNSFKRWGVELNGSIADSILKRVQHLAGQQKAIDILAKAMASRVTDDLEDTLESALCEIRGKETPEGK